MPGYRAELDDYFFEGTDNTHIAYLTVIRVQQVVLVLEFVYSGQYFEDVEVYDFQRTTIARVTPVLEAAL